MAIKQITPEEAKRLIEAGCPYIDVRTEREFAAGHPAGAVNVPVLLPDQTGRPNQLNQDFVSVIEANFPRETPVILGCQSGMRSQRGAELLARAGYADVSNMRGGFGGGRDASTGAAVVGWAAAGLPVSTQCDETNAYDALKERGAAR
jgi:rhodanese-related sulfurtransferase